MEFDLYKYLAGLGLLYTVGRLLLHYAIFAIRYLVNERTLWNPLIEKPRFLFHLCGLSVMFFRFQSHSNLFPSSPFVETINALGFLGAFYFCHFSWLDRFEHGFSAKKSNGSTLSNCNFGLRISDMELDQLYMQLVRYDLLDQNLTSASDFKVAMTLDWKEHDSEIHLKMDGPSAREFLDQMIKTFPENSLTIKNFFQTSGVVRRADGLPYKYNTVKNAPSRSLHSKRHEDLNQIFQRHL